MLSCQIHTETSYSCFITKGERSLSGEGRMHADHQSGVKNSHEWGEAARKRWDLHRVKGTIRIFYQVTSGWGWDQLVGGSSTEFNWLGRPCRYLQKFNPPLRKPPHTLGPRLKGDKSLRLLPWALVLTEGETPRDGNGRTTGRVGWQQKKRGRKSWRSKWESFSILVNWDWRWKSAGGGWENFGDRKEKRRSREERLLSSRLCCGLVG